jgi:hypothetical protein
MIEEHPTRAVRLENVGRGGPRCWLHPPSPPPSSMAIEPNPDCHVPSTAGCHATAWSPPRTSRRPQITGGRWLYGLGERMPARALDHNLTAPAVPRTLRSTPSWMVWPTERRPTVHRAEAPTAPVAGTAPPSLGERRCRRAEHPTHVPQIIWPPRGHGGTATGRRTPSGRLSWPATPVPARVCCGQGIRTSFPRTWPDWMMR